MRVPKSATAISLSAVLAFSAGIAVAGDPIASDRLNGAFDGSDDKCDSESSDIEVIGSVLLFGNRFFTWTQANGIGTGGDEIWLFVGSDSPNKGKANDNSGSVSQKEWSEFCVRINSADEGRNLDEVCEPIEKCSVKGKTNVNSQETIKVDTSAKCSGDGSTLYGALTAPQIQSIETAFPKGNKCGVKVDIQEPGKKSSLSIKMNEKDGELTFPDSE